VAVPGAWLPIARRHTNRDICSEIPTGIDAPARARPRASGFRPGVSLKTFGIEKRLGGHTFQLNVSNSLGA